MLLAELTSRWSHHAGGRQRCRSSNDTARTTSASVVPNLDVAMRAPRAQSACSPTPGAGSQREVGVLGACPCVRFGSYPRASIGPSFRSKPGYLLTLTRSDSASCALRSSARDPPWTVNDLDRRHGALRTGRTTSRLSERRRTGTPTLLLVSQCLSHSARPKSGARSLLSKRARRRCGTLPWSRGKGRRCVSGARTSNRVMHAPRPHHRGYDHDGACLRNPTLATLVAREPRPE